MDRNDGLIGQCKTRIEVTNRLSVPFGNLAEINVRKHRTGQTKLSWADTFDVHHWHHASDDNWKLHEARGGQFFRAEWSEAPKSTVLLFICRMPTPDPTAW